MKINLCIAKMLMIVLFLFNACAATPLNNVFDTQPIYTVFGADKYFKELDKGEVRIAISPFYQQTSTVRNGDGKKVRAGDRLGQWNMFGVFFGTQNVSPADKPFNLTNYPNLYAAKTSVAQTSKYTADGYRYHSDYPTPPDTNLTQEQYFIPKTKKLDDRGFAYVGVPLNYEKIGLRGQLNCDFGFGLGVSVKGGVVDVKQKFSGFVLEEEFYGDIGGGDSETLIKEAQELYNALYFPSQFNAIAKDLDLDISSYHKASAEDLHMQLYWHFPIDVEDKAGDVAMIFVPYFAAGFWFPLGEKHDTNKPFSVPTGNDGYWGFTADFSLGFDFPVLPQPGMDKDPRTLQLCLGGGVLAFNEEKDWINERFYSSDVLNSKEILQSGIIPWKVSALHKDPGLTWYMNVSLKAEEFIDNLSVYMDYIYTQHLKDSVHTKESNLNRDKYFQAGIDRYETESEWKNQQVNFALNYRITDNIALGGAVQAHISGVRVYRSTTLLGSVLITF
jgi:hypothetical protein